jgi:hypothetical protein
MSNFEEKLNILKKKKLTAKTIVEQQRNEIRTLKSSLTLNQRLEEIFHKLTNQNNLNRNLYDKIMHKNYLSNNSNEEIHRIINDLSKLIEQILIILSIDHNLDFNNQELDIILKQQKESFQLIKWKLSDIYANRIADEVSCITS